MGGTKIPGPEIVMFHRVKF